MAYLNSPSMLRRGVATLSLLATLAWPAMAPAQERFIVMASTTSTEQSGLFKQLLPAFKQATGIDVRVVAVGTGRRWTPAAAATPTWCSCTTWWPSRS